MTEDKQIVYKMIEDICPFYKDGMCYANLPLKPFECRHNCGFAVIGAVVYGKGYRKASEVAREIFAEIEERIDSITIVMGRLDSLRTYHKTLDKVMAELAELKKKYTEGEGCL